MKRLLFLLIGLALLGGCSPATGQAPQPVNTTPSSSQAERHATPPVPIDLNISKIRAQSSLIPLGVNNDGTIEVPPVSQPRQAGWYRFGPAPGQPGPAVILGHVDGNGQKGIFSRLKELMPGDEVTVSRTDGSSVRFGVTRVDQVPKASFPTDAVYGDTPDAELRLITCGGVFDRMAHSYEDNIIVYAILR